MIETLRELRKKVAVGFVSGSDLPKIKEQLEIPGTDCKLILSSLKLLLGNKYSACRHGLLFLRKWPNCIQVGTSPTFRVVHQLYWRRALQDSGQLYSPLHCRPGHSHQAVGIISYEYYAPIPLNISLEEPLLSFAKA